MMFTPLTNPSIRHGALRYFRRGACLVPIGGKTKNTNLRKRGIKQKIMPVSRLPGRVLFRKFMDRTRNAISLPMLLKMKNTPIFSNESCDNSGIRRKGSGHAIREILRILIVGRRQNAERAFNTLTGIVCFAGNVLEHVGHCFRIAFNQEHGDGRGNFFAVRPKYSRSHSTGRTAAIMTDRLLTHAALPVQKMIAKRQARNSFFHGKFCLTNIPMILNFNS